jgi:hypothetical protein
MGRGILITVIGVSLITAFLVLKLNANSKQGLQKEIKRSMEASQVLI